MQANQNITRTKKKMLKIKKNWQLETFWIFEFEKQRKKEQMKFPIFKLNKNLNVISMFSPFWCTRIG